MDVTSHTRDDRLSSKLCDQLESALRAAFAPVGNIRNGVSLKVNFTISDGTVSTFPDFTHRVQAACHLIDTHNQLVTDEAVTILVSDDGRVMANHSYYTFSMTIWPTSELDTRLATLAQEVVLRFEIQLVPD